MKRLCQYCGEELIAKHGRAETCHECSKQYAVLLSKNNSKIRHEKPRKTEAELEAIRQKYKNGLPAGEVEKWINGEKI